MIYLDSGATSLQKPPEVGTSMMRALATMASPGRGGHSASMAAADVVFRCRETAGRLFHVPDIERVVFTSSATHALNIAIKSLVQAGDAVVISPWEHNAVTRPLHAIGDVDIRVAQCDLFDRVGTISAFERAITSDVKAVVFTHVSNVFGYILPVEEIAALCRMRQIPFVIDASQSAGCLAVDFEELGADFIAMPGHKGLLGPQGTGILLCGSSPKTLIQGGTGSDSILQEMPDFLPDQLEAGTHNVPGIAGLMAGMNYILQRGTVGIHAHEQALIYRMGCGLHQIRGVEVFRAKNMEDQAGVLSFRVVGVDCEEIGEMLSQRGIAVRAGLHCAPFAHRNADTLHTGTIRASVSPFTCVAEIDRFIKTMGEIV